MTAEQFAYWLQGYAELNEAPPSAEQWQSIREHLGTVFAKVTQPIQASPNRPPNWMQSGPIAAPHLDTRSVC